MRNFSKAASKLQDIVNERANQLTKLPFQKLKLLSYTPTEHLTVESRPATIDIIVQPLPAGIRVVVQGFVKAKLLGKNVALAGFYKYSDETVAQMPEQELYQFD
jgi:hypothetical protein